MRIELAEHSGFCMGVRSALIKAVDIINNSSEEVYIDGPLIHNPQTVDILGQRGLTCLDDIDDIDDKIIAVRTHGIPIDRFKEIKQRSRKVINLTCKKVSFVQGVVKKYSLKGYHTIILGDNNHAEVLSIKSYANSGVTIISNLESVDTIPQADKYLLVAQTTLDIHFFNQAVEKIKSKFETIEIINTICSATRDRQDDLYRAIEKGVDAIVVVGGKNSANTKRLVEICRENNVTVFHVETEKELRKEDFSRIKFVLVSAGASTPSWIINNVLEKLYEIKYSKRLRLFAFVKTILEFFIRANIVSALVSTVFTIAVLRCFNSDCSDKIVWLSPLYIYIMYTINNFFQSDLLQLSNPFKYRLYSRFKFFLWTILVVLLFCYILISFRLGTISFVLYSTALAAGILYGLPQAKRLVSKVPVKQIRVLYGAKSFVSSLGWAFVVLVVPYILMPFYLLDFIPLFIIISSIIIVRNVLLDLLDYQGDLLLGIETSPTMFGIQLTRFLFILLSLLFILSVTYSVIFGSFAKVLYVINFLYYYLLYKMIKRTNYLYRLKYELLIDLNLILFAGFVYFCSIG